MKEEKYIEESGRLFVHAGWQLGKREPESHSHYLPQR